MAVDLEIYRSAVGIFNDKIQAMFLKVIKYEMPLYLHLLFYCIRLLSWTCCVANTVVTFVIFSILKLNFSLVVLLITLMSGDISENPWPSSRSSSNNISLSVKQLIFVVYVKRLNLSRKH